MVNGLLPMDNSQLPAGNQQISTMRPSSQGPPSVTEQGQQPPQSKWRNYRKNPLGPKDAEELEKFTISATKLIHSPKSRDTILNRIGVSQKGPIDDISSLALVVVDRIDQQFAKETGKKVDETTKIQGANNIVGQIIEVAEIAGKIPKMSEDERAVTYTYAVQKYIDRMINRGEATKEELAEYAEEAKNIAKQTNLLPSDDQNSEPDMSATATVKPEDPFNPSETMSQKLSKKGILDDR